MSDAGLRLASRNADKNKTCIPQPWTTPLLTVRIDLHNGHFRKATWNKTSTNNHINCRMVHAMQTWASSKWFSIRLSLVSEERVASKDACQWDELRLYQRGRDLIPPFRSLTYSFASRHVYSGWCLYPNNIFGCLQRKEAQPQGVWHYAGESASDLYPLHHISIIDRYSQFWKWEPP